MDGLFRKEEDVAFPYEEFIAVDAHGACAADDIDGLIMMEMIMSRDEGFRREEVDGAEFAFSEETGDEIGVFLLEESHQFWNVGPLRYGSGSVLPHDEEE